MEDTNNIVELTGTVMGRPEYSHSGRDECYYTFPLGVERLSGVVDVVNVIVRCEMLRMLEVEELPRLNIKGELRSYNNKSGVGSRLVITVLAQKLEFTDGEDMNSIVLHGTLCKAPNLRKTPMGRDICDLMVAVNRRYGKSDYLPCIAWGIMAEEAADWDVGTELVLSGRIQSRKYVKLESGEKTEKTAFEVSVMKIAKIEADQP